MDDAGTQHPPADRPEESGAAIPTARRREPEALPRSLALAKLLDSQFTVPGTTIQFGWDAIIGLIPVVGDTVSTGLGTLIVADAVKLGARKRVVAKMLWNLGVDWVLGLVPVVDVVADVWYKANAKNAALLKEEWERKRDGRVVVEVRPQRV